MINFKSLDVTLLTATTFTRGIFPCEMFPSGAGRHPIHGLVDTSVYVSVCHVPGPALYTGCGCTCNCTNTTNTIHPSDFKNFWNVYYTFHYNIAFLKFIFLALCSGLIIQISSRSYDRLMWDISEMYRYLLFMFWRGWWLQILADQFINVMYKVNKHSLKIVRLLK